MTPQSLAGTNFGVGILSSAIAGYGQYSSGQNERRAYDYDAMQQAEAITQRTRSTVGRQASGYAASGVDIASGSPLLVMAATAGRGAKEEEETTAGLRYQGAMAAWSGVMAGIGTFLSGMTKSASAYSSTFKPPSPSVSPQSMVAGLPPNWMGP